MLQQHELALLAIALTIWDHCASDFKTSIHPPRKLDLRRGEHLLLEALCALDEQELL